MIKDGNEIVVPQSVQENWQEVVNVISEIVNVPAALIMRIDAPHIQVFVSSKTEGNPYHVGGKEILEDSGLYCENVIKNKRELLVPNALADEKWKDNPDVKLHMISYLGFPILLPDGNPFGTICVLDVKENAYSETFEKLIRRFRDLVQAVIGPLFMNQVLGDKNKRLTDYLRELQALRGFVTICANCKRIKDAHANWLPIEHFLIRHPEAEFSHGMCPECAKKFSSDIPLGVLKPDGA